MLYKKVYLDSRALDFYVDKFKSGKALSLEFLSRVKEGLLFTILPKDLITENLYNFEYSLKGLTDEFSHNILYQEIQKHLMKENNIVIAEDSCASEGDSFLCKINHLKMFYRENVYHILNSYTNDIEKISLFVSNAENAWQNIFFFSSIPDNMCLSNNAQLTEEQIAVISSRVEKVFADAYDVFGFVCWEAKD